MKIKEEMDEIGNLDDFEADSGENLPSEIEQTSEEPI